MYWHISGHYPSQKLIAIDWIVRLYLAPGRMVPGVTFTVEPAISEGSPQVRSHIQFLLHNFACYSESEFQIKVLKDGWTAVSRDDSRSTIIVKLARRYHPIKNDISNCKIVKSPFLAIHALDNAYTSLTDPYPHFIFKFQLKTLSWKLSPDLPSLSTLCWWQGDHNISFQFFYKVAS